MRKTVTKPLDPRFHGDDVPPYTHPHLYGDDEFFNNQKGAMFGLDARISLAIFGALSVIAGAYTVLTMDDIYANSFAKELSQTSVAIENIHRDLKRDLHKSLINNTDKNAFIALYDRELIESGRLRARWLGPYITANTPSHSRFGEARVIKYAGQAGQECFPEAVCYLWLSYDNVGNKVAEALDTKFDGLDIEEASPEMAGRVQWKAGYDDSHSILYFRASRAMSGVGYQ